MDLDLRRLKIRLADQVAQSLNQILSFENFLRIETEQAEGNDAAKAEKIDREIEQGSTNQHLVSSTDATQTNTGSQSEIFLYEVDLAKEIRQETYFGFFKLQEDNSRLKNPTLENQNREDVNTDNINYREQTIGGDSSLVPKEIPQNYHEKSEEKIFGQVSPNFYHLPAQKIHLQKTEVDNSEFKIKYQLRAKKSPGVVKLNHKYSKKLEKAAGHQFSTGSYMQTIFREKNRPQRRSTQKASKELAEKSVQGIGNNSSVNSVEKKIKQIKKWALEDSSDRSNNPAAIKKHQDILTLKSEGMLKRTQSLSINVNQKNDQDQIPVKTLQLFKISARTKSVSTIQSCRSNSKRKLRITPIDKTDSFLSSKIHHKHDKKLIPCAETYAGQFMHKKCLRDQKNRSNLQIERGATNQAVRSRKKKQLTTQKAQNLSTIIAQDYFLTGSTINATAQMSPLQKCNFQRCIQTQQIGSSQQTDSIPVKSCSFFLKDKKDTNMPSVFLMKNLNPNQEDNSLLNSSSMCSFQEHVSTSPEKNQMNLGHSRNNSKYLDFYEKLDKYAPKSTLQTNCLENKLVPNQPTKIPLAEQDRNRIGRGSQNQEGKSNSLRKLFTFLEKKRKQKKTQGVPFKFADARIQQTQSGVQAFQTFDPKELDNVFLKKADSRQSKNLGKENLSPAKTRTLRKEIGPSEFIEIPSGKIGLRRFSKIQQTKPFPRHPSKNISDPRKLTGLAEKQDQLQHTLQQINRTSPEISHFKVSLRKKDWRERVRQNLEFIPFNLQISNSYWLLVVTQKLTTFFTTNTATIQM